MKQNKTPSSPTNPRTLTPKSTALTKRQLQALPYLVTTNNLTEGAKLAEISRATLYRWMEDQQFRKEFDRLRQQASELAYSELKGLMLKAAHVLAEGMEHDNPHVRIRSARTAMEMGFKATETTTIMERLDRLDKAFSLKKGESQS